MGIGAYLLSMNFLVVSERAPSFFNDVVFLAYMIALVPPMLVNYLDLRSRGQVDRQLPTLLREVADGQLAGKTLFRSFEDASTDKRGRLYSELRNTLARIEMGANFHSAINDLGDSLGTKLSKQSMKLILVSDLFGGSTYDVFDEAADYVESILEYREERKSKVSSYVFTFYFAVLLFVALTVMLLKWLLPAFRSLPTASFPLFAFAIKPIGYYRDIFLTASIIVSTFAGLTCGRLSHGSLSAGIKHILFLTLASYLTFLTLVGT